MDLDTLLRQTQAVPDLSSSAFDRGARALQANVDIARRGLPVRQVRRRPSRRATAGVTIAAAVAALIVLPTVAVHGQPSSSAQAAGVLERAATAAGRQPGGWLRAPYWHVVEQEQRGSRIGRREIWIGHVRRGVLIDPLVTGQRGTVPLDVGRFLDSPITWNQLDQLPTKPAALDRALRANAISCGCGPDVRSDIFDEATEVLSESPAPPALRKALWEVASQVPGVQDDGPATDALGRPGIAIRRGYQTFVVDPSSGTLLQSTGNYPIERDRRGQIVSGGTYRYTYIDQGPADEAPTVG